jgi:hypothetical protein
MSDGRRTSRDNGPPCPRCGAEMKEVVTIAPLGGEPGLIAYECSKCAHLMSVLYQAPRPA